MKIAEAIGHMELRIEETETLYIKGKKKDDISRIEAEGRVEGMKEGLTLLKSVAHSL